MVVMRRMGAGRSLGVCRAEGCLLHRVHVSLVEARHSMD